MDELGATPVSHAEFDCDWLRLEAKEPGVVVVATGTEEELRDMDDEIAEEFSSKGRGGGDVGCNPYLVNDEDIKSLTDNLGSFSYGERLSLVTAACVLYLRKHPGTTKFEIYSCIEP